MTYFYWECPKCGFEEQNSDRDALKERIGNHPCRVNKNVVWEERGPMPTIPPQVWKEIREAAWTPNEDGASEYASLVVMRSFLERRYTNEIMIRSPKGNYRYWARPNWAGHLVKRRLVRADPWGGAAGQTFDF